VLHTSIDDRGREYIRCEQCARVVTVADHPLDPLRPQLKSNLGQDLSLARFVFFGVCDRCNA